MPDTMKATILEDGTVKLEVEGQISDAVHLQAEHLVQVLAERLGGDVTVDHKTPDHQHGHSHGHGHSHQH